MELNVLLQSNKRKFVDDDSTFVYVLNNTNKDGFVQYWTCEKKGFCGDKIHVSNGRVATTVGDHTHEPGVNAVKASVFVVFVDDIKRETETSRDTTRNIIYEMPFATKTTGSSMKLCRQERRICHLCLGSLSNSKLSVAICFCRVDAIEKTFANCH